MSPLVRRFGSAFVVTLAGAAACLSGTVNTNAGPMPLFSLPGDPLPVSKVYVFGKDDRVALPRQFSELKYKIGLIYSANTRHGCTASCVAKDVILTAAHCVLSSSARKRKVETAGVKFVLPSKHIKNEYIVANVLHKADYSPRNIVSGFPVTRAQAGQGKREDWALVKLGSNACRYGSLPLRAIPSRDLLAASKKGALFEVAFHGDRNYGKTLLYTDKCRLMRQKSLKRKGPGPALIQHRCDLTSGASGSPLLVNRKGGPVIVAVNVAEFATQRYIRRGRKIIRYYKKKPSHNLAINARVFQDQLAAVAGAKVVSTRSALKEIQSGLKRLNLYSGKLDGVFGPATWKALRTFEKRQDRKPLGLPTTNLLRELREISGNAGPAPGRQASNLAQ